jgi:3-oxocholest-4-en-26-oate---CoA ligase
MGSGPFTSFSRTPQHEVETVMKPITSGGESIFPDEVEAVLRYHPDVEDAAVVGLPDRRMGQYLVALVSSKAGHAAPSTEQVRTFCIGRLTGFKVPRQVLTVEAIPYDGKRVDYDRARATATARLGLPAIP